MKDRAALRGDLERIDGRSYGYYKDLRGRVYQLGPAALRFAHVQGDPFAAPSRLVAELPPGALPLPQPARHSRDARRASADYLQRELLAALSGPRRRGGSGAEPLVRYRRKADLHRNQASDPRPPRLEQRS